MAGSGQGDRRSLRKGSSLEFADFRHYVPGDDPNRVDWSVYGRTGQLFVRVYEEEELLNVHVLVDASRSMDWGEPNKLQYARQLAASLGYLALSGANRLHVWPLASGAQPFGPAWGRQRAAPMVKFLTDLKPAQTETPVSVPGMNPAPPDVDAQLGSTSNRASGLNVFLSDLLSPTWEQALRRVAARSGDSVVLHVLAPQELRPQLGSDVRLIDRETGAAVAVTLNNDAIRLYGQRLDEWRAKVEGFCTRHSMGYVLVDTEVPLETTLFDTLRRRGVVR